MKTLSLISILFIALNIATGCSSAGHRTFRGICADDPNGKEGLYNPERGFRLEVALDVRNKTAVWARNDNETITSLLESQSEMYASDSVSLCQTYFYLTDIIGEPISEEDFKTMDIFFDKLRELGKKAVLRFAYEKDFMGRASKGPTLEDIVLHTQQLKPFLEKNKDVIFVLQAGFIGAWGEWHSSVNRLESTVETRKTILEHICDMTPVERYVQIRVPTYKNFLAEDKERYNRLSFHDDMIIIKPHPWDAGMSEGTAHFDQILKECPYLPVDGELPWGEWSVGNDKDNHLEQGWLVDGPEAARRFFLQHFASLSVIHNYKELKNGLSGKYSMQIWKETPIDEEFLAKNRMPISNGYFSNKDGSHAQRNVFDYVRDHVGYRIELQNMAFPKNLTKDGDKTLKITLINRGFSTLFNEHPVYITLLNSANEVCASIKTDADVNSWQPYQPGDTLCTPLVHTINATLSVPEGLPKGDYKIGLWIPDGSERLMMNHRFALRCANGDTQWWISPDGKYGINILDTIRVR